MNTPLKRFIAGATCPQCKAQDSLYMLSNDTSSIACTRCSHIEKKNNNNNLEKTSAATTNTLTWLEK